MLLFNKIDKKVLKHRALEKKEDRKTFSFYRYVPIEDPNDFRDRLYLAFNELGVLGRIYLAKEGINAQISSLVERLDDLKEALKKFSVLSSVRLNEAVCESSYSFYKLIIKVRKKIVADGLSQIDLRKIGRKINAEEFNNLVANEQAVIIDVRNHYETEVGHVKGAILFDGETFRSQLPKVLSYLELEKKKENPIAMYCTGGIRCEKASAYLIERGFKNVSMLDGGIISYASEVKKKQLPNAFVGKNFVFDSRLGERITSDVISRCHQCGAICDDHTNCCNDECHLLFIQCQSCREKMQGCCSARCVDIIGLPIEKQRELRRNKVTKNAHHVYRKGFHKALLS